MTDREKLIDLITEAGLKYATIEGLADHLLNHGVTIKEPKRPMTKEELIHLPDDPVVYLEFANGLIIPKIIMRYRRGCCYGYMHWTDGQRADMLDYGKTWRCWAEKPTEEERMAEKWD